MRTPSMRSIRFHPSPAPESWPETRPAWHARAIAAIAGLGVFSASVVELSKRVRMQRRKTGEPRILTVWSNGPIRTILDPHGRSAHEPSAQMRPKSRRRAKNTTCKIAVGVLAGAVLGAAAVQGLQAQAKPKAYIVTESEVLDAAGLAAYAPTAQAAIRAAGGRSLAPATTKAVAFIGDPPKRVGISEWESMEKAQAWRLQNSARHG
jgi:uncharacterized protein (DUF1330 family)